INGAFEPACTIDATHLAADTLDFLLDWMIDVPIAVHRGAENFRKRKHAGMLTRAVVVDRGWSLSRADELIARSNIYDCRGAAVQLFLSCLDLLQNGSNCRSVAGLTPMRSANHCKFCISELELLIGATHYAGKRLKWLQGGPWKDWAFVISDSNSTCPSASATTACPKWQLSICRPRTVSAIIAELQEEAIGEDSNDFTNF